MSALVLLHGGVHGAWCWEPVLAPLTALGHEVEASDLPGRGGGEGIALDGWVAAVGATRLNQQAGATFHPLDSDHAPLCSAPEALVAGILA